MLFKEEQEIHESLYLSQNHRKNSKYLNVILETKILVLEASYSTFSVPLIFMLYTKKKRKKKHMLGMAELLRKYTFQIPFNSN